jgi:hypothetical protein
MDVERVQDLWRTACAGKWSLPAIQTHAGGDKGMEVSILAAGINYLQESWLEAWAEMTYSEIFFPECFCVMHSREDSQLRIVLMG